MMPEKATTFVRIWAKMAGAIEPVFNITQRGKIPHQAVVTIAWRPNDQCTKPKIKEEIIKITHPFEKSFLNILMQNPLKIISQYTLPNISQKR